MSSSPQRILGVDPSLRSTGYAVIEESGDPAQPFRQVVFGTIENHRNLAPSECLAAIHEKLADVIRQHQPTEAAFEAIIYAQNVKTAIVMGHARGAALLACAQSGLRIWEYSPKKVKVGVSGAGGAAKEQVSFMVRALLGLRENPPFDVADAFAVAITHAQRHPELSPGDPI